MIKEQMLEAIKRSDDDGIVAETAAIECAAIAQYYALEFAKWVGNNYMHNGFHWGEMNIPQTFLTDTELLTAFENREK